jgi:hypothetical protein
MEVAMTISGITRLMIAVLAAAPLYGQSLSWLPNPDNASLGGYVKETPLGLITIAETGAGSDTVIVEWANQVQARWNAAWYPHDMLSLVLQGRLLALSGDLFTQPGPAPAPTAAEAALDDDPNYLDVSESWPALLFGNIDRAYLGLSAGKFSARLGRQRINWGVCYVWNPLDWYNAFSFFDFSYEERRGTDAFHGLLYPSALSTAELAVEAGRTIDDRTMAALYRFNRWAYDFQLQAGLFGRDLAAGAGWAGQILDAGFRGELAYFHPAYTGDSFSPTDTAGAVVLALSGDYTFPTSLYLHAEALYNGFGSHSPPGHGLAGQAAGGAGEPVTAQNLSPARYSLFGEVAYSFTPLIRGTLSAILYRFAATSDHVFFWSPSLQWSVVRNIDVMILGQTFYQTDLQMSSTLLAAEARWSF